jgi:EAL domain-containing protein (putative c-di-GMP-specific phosphodiesterase class I)
MYHAKELGKDNFCFFTESMNQQTRHRLATEQKLRLALERQEFQLFYQPQIDMKSGKLISIEALLRWTRPDGGFSAPDEFIPILEDSGLIVPTGLWVMEEACRQTRYWQTIGFPDLRVAVNFSARQLRQPDIASKIQTVLKNTGLPPESLEVEITESTLMDLEVSTSNLAQIFNLGVRIAIDDFGTGYSSLTYLKRFSIHTLKVDRSFVRDIITDRDDAAIVSAIIGLAKSLDIEVVAEGVETNEQLDFLNYCQCSIAQGYLVAQPMPSPQFETWARAWETSTSRTAQKLLFATV